MKKYLIMLLLLVLFSPSLVFSDLVSFRVGYFVPMAKSDLWQDEFFNMDFTKSNFQATGFSFSYEYFLSNQIGLVIGLDSYSKQKLGTYEGYVGETIDGWDYAFDYGEGFGVTHVFGTAITPIQVSIKFSPLGRRGAVIPYLGGGVGLYMWNVKLQGDMIDFTQFDWFYDPNLDEDVPGYYIDVVDAREDNKFSLGFHAFGGFMVPIANRVSIDAQFKYNMAKGDLTDAFQGFEPFDLSSYQILIGLNYWF
jgi:opacity protein-like surface antigen